MTARNLQTRPVRDPWPGGNLLIAIVFTGAVFAAAWLSMTLSARMVGVSPIWLANGLVVGILAGRSPQLVRWSGLSAVAIFAANLATGTPLALAAAMTAINVAEIAGLLTMLRSSSVSTGRPAGLVRFIALAVVAALLSALIAAAMLHVITGAAFATVLEIWLTSDLLGLLIIVPPLAGLRWRDVNRLHELRQMALAATLSGLTGFITFAVFSQQPYPLLFLVLPCLILSTFTLGYLGAALANTVAVLVAVAMTSLGQGPIAYRLADPYARTLLLQLFLAINALVTFPVAALLKQSRYLTATLRDNERRARQLAENIPAAVIAVRNGRISYANPGFATLTGRAVEAVNEKPFDEMLADGAPPLDWTSRPGAPVHADEVPLLRADGTSRYVALSATPQHGDQDDANEWIVLLFDIDERRDALRRIEASERLHRLLADNSHDMVVRIGIDGVRRYISPACERLLGYTADELLGETPIAAIHADDRARVEQTIRSLLDGAIDPLATYRQRHRDGHYVWLEAVYRLVRDPLTDAPVEFVASVRDVTSRRAAERAATTAAGQLKESNRLLTMAEKMAHVGHWRLDTVTQALFWSSEVYAIHGRSVDHVPTLASGIDAYHPGDRARVAGLLEVAIGQGDPFSFEARIVRPGGEIRWVAASGQTESAPNGEIVGVFGVFCDITERVVAEQELIAARVAAEEALEARSVFTSTLTHEIRTPLTGLLAAAELLRSGSGADDQRRHLDALHRSAELLSSIIDDVLIFSKLDEGQLETEHIDFDLGALCRVVVVAFTASAAQKQISLVVDGDIPTRRVVGDPTRIQRVLANLLSNAVKFTDRGGIVLRVEHIVDEGLQIWRFTVADTGIGIPPMRIDDIFDPFVQADASITRSRGGTGLGLAICRMLVDAMGGQICVRSDAAGSEFAFTLPLPDAAPSTAAAPVSEPVVSSRSLDVLVAEDNDTNRYLIVALLERLGHSVATVENGALAVEAARTRGARPFDLILMDVQMPVMDGIAATQAIRALPGPAGSTPICAVTADDIRQRRVQLLAAGLNDVLAKPIRRDALERVLGAFDRAAPPRDADESRFLESATAIDADRVAALTATVGVAGRDKLLALLIDDAQRRPRAIRACFEQGRYDQMAMEAHSLRGAAAIVGAETLVGTLRRLEQAIDTKQVEAAAVIAVEAAADAVSVQASELRQTLPG
ncbi:PAS domain S-box protein [Sphingomonas sp. SUN019]|uniref:PAS domain S-box protein n=1 Tax=Sphingomonas sp. SUN019 TaxID=2937788 RepID=UPI00216428AB|nr:PAS domain S-box protein [Sphingomonas sp. SUN019]UVO51288.1 PAS domain S-box protein [Sphingomonas sp. SUN019]